MFSGRMRSRKSKSTPLFVIIGEPRFLCVLPMKISCGFFFFFFFSSPVQVQAPPVTPATPPPTAVPEVASGETADIVQAAAEQSFSELGLGSYTPVGLIQNLLEFMHVNLGLPWWGAIATCKENISCTRVKEMGTYE